MVFPDRLQLPEIDVRLAVRTQKPPAIVEQVQASSAVMIVVLDRRHDFEIVPRAVRRGLAVVLRSLMRGDGNQQVLDISDAEAVIRQVLDGLFGVRDDQTAVLANPDRLVVAEGQTVLIPAVPAP